MDKINSFIDKIPANIIYAYIFQAAKTSVEIAIAAYTISQNTNIFDDGFLLPAILYNTTAFILYVSLVVLEKTSRIKGKKELIILNCISMLSELLLIVLGYTNQDVNSFKNYLIVCTTLSAIYIPAIILTVYLLVKIYAAEKNVKKTRNEMLSRFLTEFIPAEKLRCEICVHHNPKNKIVVKLNCGHIFYKRCILSVLRQIPNCCVCKINVEIPAKKKLMQKI